MPVYLSSIAPLAVQRAKTRPVICSWMHFILHALLIFVRLPFFASHPPNFINLEQLGIVLILYFFCCALRQSNSVLLCTWMGRGRGCLLGGLMQVE